MDGNVSQEPISMVEYANSVAPVYLRTIGVNENERITPFFSAWRASVKESIMQSYSDISGEKTGMQHMDLWIQM